MAVELTPAEGNNAFLSVPLEMRTGRNAADRRGHYVVWIPRCCGVHLLTPTIRGTDARNTDGIDPGSSSNITVAHSWIETYTGQSFLLVDGLTEDHTTSGIRIKSNVTRGGPVHDLVYRNICMRGVKNPIAISPYYTNQTTEGFADPQYTGDRIPDYKAISISNVIDTTPGDVLIAGLNDEHRTELTLDGVRIDGIKREQVQRYRLWGHRHQSDSGEGFACGDATAAGVQLRWHVCADGVIFRWRWTLLSSNRAPCGQLFLRDGCTAARIDS